MKKSLLKKITAVILTVFMVTSLAACSASTTNKGTTGKKLKVGIIQMIENGAFDDMRDGFIQELRDKGYSEDQLEIVVKNAQGDTSNLNTIAQEMSDGSYDLVATIATPASQTFVNMKSQTPQVFIAVSDPVKAGIVSTMEKPDHNATGTSNPIPVQKIIDLSKTLTPGIKTFGIIYNTSEVNSVSTVNKAKEYMAAQGYAVAEAVVTNSSEVQQAIEGLLSGVDAIFIPNDSVIQNAMPTVAEAAKTAKKPVYGSSAVMVNSGALATVAIGDKAIGAATADMAIEILKGKSPADIPAVNVEATNTVINQTTADAIGVTIPADSSQSTTIVK
ncbi:ABC transporter substrate-binding protein [Acetobacterium paludosum]|uniref:ABC transporter substrate-binding protein n=1 Tax=Acetobacterium paludosum TaxID=52693 RepID=A0A923KXV0_9FIRM|nr:ABC transporter substrate-binding protein [Acetobacterium paludosum]MBC3888816.1 ABC transporter substrate-binding protein [Acetobacterium paludosum]